MKVGFGCWLFALELADPMVESRDIIFRPYTHVAALLVTLAVFRITRKMQ